MPDKKKIKDTMLDIFEFPHVPYWFTIKQAIEIMKKSKAEAEKKCLYPQTILIFEEKYNLVGTLSLRDILKGIEPKIIRPDVQARFADIDDETLSSVLGSFFNAESKELVTKPVKDVMTPVVYHVTPDDSVTKAAFLMLHHNLVILPVLEGKKKLVGIVRMQEVFEEVSNIIIGT